MALAVLHGLHTVITQGNTVPGDLESGTAMQGISSGGQGIAGSLAFAYWPEIDIP